MQVNEGKGMRFHGGRKLERILLCGDISRYCVAQVRVDVEF
jgi:hypothetical protein